MKTNRGLFAKCIVAVTVMALLFQPGLADAAQKKKKKSHHRPALAIAPINQKNPKYAAIVIDAETGTILSSDSADALRHPASLTKMMTLLMVFDAIHNGELRLNQRITVSARASSMPASKLGLRAGSSIQLNDAISSLATLSANDMAVALAETIGGSESAFARKMTAKAAAIGMSRTRFYNASGLPNDYQVTTARDMARLARYLLTHYPNESRVFAKQRFDYNGRTYSNHNRLMETYAGMDCCKTGYINASGFNLVASAKRDGRRLIGVVFGGRSTVTRNVQMASLLDAGFDKAKSVQMAAVAQPAPTPVISEQQPKQNPYAPSKPPAAEKEVVLASASTAAANEVIQEAYYKAENNKSTPLQIKQMGSAPQTLGTVNMTDDNAPVIDSNPYEQASLTAPSDNTSTNSVSPGNGWAIQIGAYQTRLATDQAIAKAQRLLPPGLRKGSSTVVPLRTADASWMFRARLSGYTQSEAEQACKYFKDCLMISPQAY